MSMTIPHFVKLEHDTVARKAFVSVEDREVKKQREMWGMAFSVTSVPEPRILTSPRNHSSVPTKSHPRRIRRTHSNSSISWSWIQSYSREHCNHCLPGVRGPAIRGIESRIFASYRTSSTQGCEGQHSSTNKDIVRGCREGGGVTVCCRDSNVEKT